WAASERQISYYNSSWPRRVPHSYSKTSPRRVPHSYSKTSPRRVPHSYSKTSPRRVPHSYSKTYPRRVPDSYSKTSTTKYNMARLLMQLILFALTSSLCLAQMPGPGCECDYRTLGCILLKHAPPDSACHCELLNIPLFPPICQGTVVPCINETSVFCIAPGLNFPTCLQGGGNCAGYGLSEFPSPVAFCVVPSTIDSTQREEEPATIEPIDL
ncbi:unnamed protein product, partial [Meganyctiphanes norvegica]